MRRVRKGKSGGRSSNNDALLLQYIEVTLNIIPPEVNRLWVCGKEQLNNT
jgi:hypothetical protein